MRLRQLERRHSDLALERAPQMALTDAKLSRQIRDAAAVQRPRRNPLRRHLREPRDRGERGRPPSGRELRPTPQARPEPRPLGSRR